MHRNDEEHLASIMFLKKRKGRSFREFCSKDPSLGFPATLARTAGPPTRVCSQDAGPIRRDEDCGSWLIVSVLPGTFQTRPSDKAAVESGEKDASSRDIHLAFAPAEFPF